MPAPAVIAFSREDASRFAELTLRRGIPWESLSRSPADAECVLRAAFFLLRSAPALSPDESAAEKRLEDFLAHEADWLEATPRELLAHLCAYAGTHPEGLAKIRLHNSSELSRAGFGRVIADFTADMRRRRESIRRALQEKNRRLNAPQVPTDGPEADREHMRRALRAAQRAAESGEVPVGAVLVWADGKSVETENRVRRLRDPTAHAEILAIREACRRSGSERLSDAVLYVTLEPCPMCAAAIAAARVRRVVWAADNPLSGGMGGTVDVAQAAHLNHRAQTQGGVLAQEGARILDEFFASKRDAR